MKSRKLVLLAAMLAMVLSVSVPATAQVSTNTGNAQSSQGIAISDSGDACREGIIGTLAGELGVTSEEAAEIVASLDPTSAKDFDELVEQSCVS